MLNKKMAFVSNIKIIDSIITDNLHKMFYNYKADRIIVL